MPDVPLQPFAPPTALLQQFNISGLPSSGATVEWTLYAVFAFWAVYTLVAIYHWLRYSHASWVAFPAMAVHILVSLCLMSYALIGNALWLAPYIPLP